MIDFHSHTYFSDGVLGPAEHVRRAYVTGYRALGIADHTDFSNIHFVAEKLQYFATEMQGCGWEIDILPGMEITHVPAAKMERCVQIAKDLSVPLLIVHGETTTEPVEPGTNRAAIEAGIDILAHPGLILEEDVKRAAELGVHLEITARKGHSLTNGHVARLAAQYGAKLVFNSDAHAPGDYITDAIRDRVARGCGMDDEAIRTMIANNEALLSTVKKRMTR
jgi:putative hydrolase